MVCGIFVKGRSCSRTPYPEITYLASNVPDHRALIVEYIQKQDTFDEGMKLTARGRSVEVAVINETCPSEGWMTLRLDLNNNKWNNSCGKGPVSLCIARRGMLQRVDADYKIPRARV